MNKIAISNSAPVILKENRSLFGKCDPERQVVKEASSTFSARPLLANFSLDVLSPHTRNPQVFSSLEHQPLQKDFEHFTYHYTNKYEVSKEITRLHYIGTQPQKSVSIFGKPPSRFNFTAFTKTSSQATFLEE